MSDMAVLAAKVATAVADRNAVVVERLLLVLVEVDAIAIAVKERETRTGPRVEKGRTEVVNSIWCLDSVARW